MDALPETPGPSAPASRPQPGSELRGGRRSSRGRWWRRVLVIAATAALAVATTYKVRARYQRDTRPKLTHKITRGELLVTVLEQGILESSENTEIKCGVRGRNTVISVVKSGTLVKAGDELLRLDTLFMEEQINERSKYAHWSRSGAEWSKANVVRTELAISEYEQGRYRAELLTKEKDLAIARSRLSTRQSMLTHAEMMAQRGYVSDLEIEERTFAVKQARLDVELKETQIDVLKRFTMTERLQTLKGNSAASKATHEANAERAIADASRRDRAVEELQHCIVRAPRDGMVIHPAAARWKNAPEIAVGSSVWKTQVLLLMPDLDKMQVKIGIDESVVDRIKPGLYARVVIPGRRLESRVTSVASVARPAGWWNGNAVKYDTIIRLPPTKDLKPGMSAEVEVIVARYENVLSIPVAALVHLDDGDFCWVNGADGVERRKLRLGDSNDVFTIVEEGLQEGDEVLLNPLGGIEEGQARSSKPGGKKEAGERGSTGPKKAAGN